MGMAYGGGAKPPATVGQAFGKWAASEIPDNGVGLGSRRILGLPNKGNHP
jgi:hypothetical protein